MLDYIKSLNLSEEIKNDEIYYLFKTESSEINSQFLSILKKYNTTEELLKDYTNQDCKSAFEIYKDISSIYSKVCNEEEKNTFKSEIDQYVSGLSKVIFLFSMLQKTNELLSNLLKETKKYIKKFYTENNIQNPIKEKINTCINDLMCSSLVISNRNYSRRSTKEGTVRTSKKFTQNSISKFKHTESNDILNDDDDTYLFSQAETPRFEEEDNQNIIIQEIESNNNSSGPSGKSNVSFDVIKEAISEAHSKKKFDSSLTLSKMNFVLESEIESIAQLEKTKSYNAENDSSQSCNIIKRRNKSKCIKKIKEFKNQNINLGKDKAILASFFDAISVLYKKGKINYETKISMKQSIILDSKKVIDKFLYFYEINNNNVFNKMLINENIQKFLLESFKN
jgi:hypothetical protein